jgi:hypothetical protein
MKWIVHELADTAFSSSSDFNRNHTAKLCRLNSGIAGKANWSAKTNDTNQWLQVDLGAVESLVAVAIQGRHNLDQWVTNFNIQWSSDLQNWGMIENVNGVQDRNSISIFYLPQEALARYVRFIPMEWHNHISMRVDVAIAEQNTKILINNSHENIICDDTTENNEDKVTKNISDLAFAGIAETCNIKFEKSRFKDIYSVSNPRDFDHNKWLSKVSEEINYSVEFETQIMSFLNISILKELKMMCEFRIQLAKREIPNFKKAVKKNHLLQNFLNTYQYIHNANSSMLKILNKELKKR